MRKTGKTTRLIDQAIQHLFTNGTLFVPTSWLYKEKGGFGKVFRGTGANTYDVFSDPDWEPGNRAQHDFLKRLENRIIREHGDSISITRVVKTNYVVFSLK